MRLTSSIRLIAVGLLALSTRSANSQTREDRWDWTGRVDAGRWVYVRNLNGPVRVEATSGSTVEVVAYKKATRRANPADVRITVETRSRTGDVVICAIWNERTRCDEDGYSTNSRGDRRDWWDWGRDNDRGNVSVEFVVRLPRGVRITASSVNGGIEIDGSEAEVVANTVNGSIRARSTGTVSAHTTNGSLNIRTGNLGNGTLDYSTTNGQIVLEVPEGTSADVELRTVNGGISSDFPLTIEGRFNNRSVRGSIGRGGGLLIRLRTTNGGIQLRKAF